MLEPARLSQVSRNMPIDTSKKFDLPGMPRGLIWAANYQKL